MLPVGAIVRIRGLPFYGISADFANTDFVVVGFDAPGTHYRLTAYNWNIYHFPIENENMLERMDEVNKWNKLGYVSPFKPLNLP